MKNSFAITHNFCYSDLNNFVLRFCKDKHLYEYMDYWDKFTGTYLPSEKGLYSTLNMESMTAAYKNGNKVRVISIHKLS